MVATATPTTLLAGESTVLSVLSTAGVAGKSLSFDGQSNHFQANGHYPNLHSTFTWEAWVKPGRALRRDVENENYALYPSYQGLTNDNTRSGVGVAVGMNGVYVVEHSADFLRSIVGYDGPLTDWTHVAVVYQNNLARLYINGTLRATANIRSGKLAMPSNEIGGTSSFARGRYVGAIDEVRVWNTARTAEEIRANYFRNVPNPGPSLVGAWSFDTVSGGNVSASYPAGLQATLGGSINPVDGAQLVEEDRQLTSRYEWSRDGAVITASARLQVTPQTSGLYQVRCTNCEPTCAASVSVVVTRFDGCYRLVAQHSGKVLYPDGNSYLRQRGTTGATNEIWALEPAGDGIFRIASSADGRLLTLTGTGGLTMAPLSGSPTPAQQWRLTPAAESTYRISPLTNVANSVEVMDYSQQDDASVWVPVNTGQANQRFRLETATCPVSLPPDCNLRIVSKNTADQETTTLPRKPGTTNQFDPLKLSVESLDGESLAGLTYSWSGPNSTSATATTLTASQRGEYTVLVQVPGLSNACEVTTTLSATPCQSINPTYRGCQTVTITSATATNQISTLVPGEYFYAGDYRVDVSSAMLSGSGWVGEGSIDITLMSGIKLPVRVELNGVMLNDCYEMTGGTVKTLYDPTWGNIADVDEFVDDVKEALGQVQNLLSSYKETAEDARRVQETLIPLLKEYEDVPQAKQLIEKLDALSKQCRSNNGNELSDDCKAKLAEVEAAYNQLRDIIEELPPLPEGLFPSTGGSANGRLASNMPTFTKVQLDNAAKACQVRTGCSTGIPNVLRYYGQAYIQGSEFWLVQENGQKYYIWRTTYLNQEVYGYLPYEAKRGSYTLYSPEPGKTAGAAFADAGQKLTFDIAVVLVTAGLGEGVVSELTDSFIEAAAASNGDPETFARNLSEELLFSGLGYVPDMLGSKQMKRLLAFYKPDFTNYVQNARSKLGLMNTWLADAYAKARSLSGDKLSEYKEFFKHVPRPNISHVYNAVAVQGGKFIGRNKVFVDQAGNTIAGVAQVGQDYMLTNLRLLQGAFDPVRHRVVQVVNKVKVRRTIDGQLQDVEEDLELIAESCGASGGRLAAGSSTGCNLTWRIVTTVGRKKLDFGYAMLRLKTAVVIPPLRVSLKKFAQLGEVFEPIAVDQKRLVDQIAAQGDPGGDITEALMTKIFSGKEGFWGVPETILRVGNNNGFDGLFLKAKNGLNLLNRIPTDRAIDGREIAAIADDLVDLHICECKQMTAKLSVIERLDDVGNEVELPQMSQRWVEDVIARMILSSKQGTENLGRLLNEVINRRQMAYTKSLMGVHKGEKVVCVVKIQ